MRKIIFALFLSLLAPAAAADGLLVPVPTWSATTAWTPADGSGAALSFTSVSGNYFRFGNVLYAFGRLTYPATVDGTAAKVQGLPITSLDAPTLGSCVLGFSNNPATLARANVIRNTTTLQFSTVGGGVLTNANMTGAEVIFLCIYLVS